MIADPELKMNREAYSVKSEKNESSLGNLRIRPRYSTHLNHTVQPTALMTGY